MDTAQGGTIADHVHVGVFLANEAAFESGMDGTDDGVVAEHAFVGLYAHFEHFAVGVGGPAGVAVAMGDVGSNHAEGGFDFLRCGMLGALDGAALAGGDMDLAVVHLDGGEVGGGLDEVLYLAAHGQHTVGTGVKGVEEVILGLAVDKAGGFGNGLEGDLEVGLGAAEFEADVLGKVGDHLFESLLVVVCHDDVGPSLAGDGVAQVAAVRLSGRTP